MTIDSYNRTNQCHYCIFWLPCSSVAVLFVTSFDKRFRDTCQQNSHMVSYLVTSQSALLASPPTRLYIVDYVIDTWHIHQRDYFNSIDSWHTVIFVFQKWQFWTKKIFRVFMEVLNKITAKQCWQITKR